MGSVSRPEWRRTALLALIVVAASAVPYVLAAAQGGHGWHFSGSLIGVEDGSVYLSNMRLGARGDWLLTIAFTSEPHDGALFYLPYLLLGKLAPIFANTESPALVHALIFLFHAARVFLGFGLILVLYRFISAYLPRSRRTFALIAISTGGGLGWLLILTGQSHLFGSPPLDTYSPEGYVFLALFLLPHVNLARIGMFGGLLLIFRALREDRGWWRWSLGAGALWLVMGLCVPFYTAVLYAILGAWGLASWARERRFPWRLFWRTATGAAVTVPYLAYTFYTFTTNEVFAAWGAQNVLPSPHPLHYALGYGVLASPARFAVRRAWRKGGIWLLPLAWIVAAPILVYLPFSFQRRLSEGVYVPLGILAASGLREIAVILAKRGASLKKTGRRLAIVTVALLLPTNLILLLGTLGLIAAPSRPVYRPAAEIEAMHQLNASAARDAVILSAFETGNVLPVWADVRVYLGHGPETVNLAAKKIDAARYFGGEMADRDAFYEKGRIAYVFYGSLERAVGESWQPDERLSLIYESGDYAIYEVR